MTGETRITSTSTLESVLAASERIGPYGRGFDVLRGAIDPCLTGEVERELNQDKLPWYPQINDFTNERGVLVEQHFEVFGHKLSRGRQNIMEQLPAMRRLNEFVACDIIRPLARVYATLEHWSADEVTAQRYPAEVGKLSWHKDLARHPGVVVIANITGHGGFGVRTGEQNGEITDVRPGDVVIMRAPGLHESNGDIRPEHSVVTVGELARISVTFRANNRPDEVIPDFHFHNWPVAI